jgi:hypothetical protein
VELKIEIKKEDILESIKSVNDLGNDVLYNMCKDNFEHDTDEKIIAKTNIIGRTYAVALERGNNKNKSENDKKKYITDDFFKDIVCPIFKKQEMQNRFVKLKKLKEIDGNVDTILSAHHYLTKALEIINCEEKRSFSSKYLHFHFRELFFIFDSRAGSAINKIVSHSKNEIDINEKKLDYQYALFFDKALYLQKEALKIYPNKKLNPRQLDNYLLKIGNENLRNRNKKKKV